jgi:diacylglycerol kinase family enzyme
MFVNNVSLGIYGSFVHDPRRKTKNRLLAAARLIPAAIGRSRTPLDVSFEADRRRASHRALVVLVGNNRYDVKALAVGGGRERLDEGRLHAYVVEATTRTRLLGLLARAAVGRHERADEWNEWAAESFRVETERGTLHAALDGDPVTLEPPLEFSVRKRALRVLVPAR